MLSTVITVTENGYIRKFPHIYPLLYIYYNLVHIWFHPGRNDILTGLWWKERSHYVLFTTILSESRLYPGWNRFLCCRPFVFERIRHNLVFWKTKSKKKTLSPPLQVISRMSIKPNREMKSLKLKYPTFRSTQQHHKINNNNLEKSPETRIGPRNGWCSEVASLSALLGRLQLLLRRPRQLLPHHPSLQEEPLHFLWHSSCPCSYQRCRYRGKSYIIILTRKISSILSVLPSYASKHLATHRPS